MDLERVQATLRQFARERDWEQFHHPKNLAMALAAESGELVEVFQWLSDVESRTAASDSAVVESASQEIADIFIYLVRLADVLGVDVARAVNDKIEANARRYPISTVRGIAGKQP